MVGLIGRSGRWSGYADVLMEVPGMSIGDASTVARPRLPGPHRIGQLLTLSTAGAISSRGAVPARYGNRLADRAVRQASVQPHQALEPVREALTECIELH